jgi:uncharacterized protein YndB with AHSA1/START domain
MTMAPEPHAVVHSTFTIDRDYPQAPARVFKAFADPVAKRRWYAEGEGFTVLRYDLDFRVDGAETSRFSYQGGPEISNDTHFYAIVPNRRIVAAYRMLIGGNFLSVSLATMEFIARGKGTRLTYTEQGVYLSEDDVKNRKDGCAGLLEMLAKELEKGEL